MDIVSHGLWGGVAFGRKNRKSFWLSFLFGVLPDIFSFGILFVFTFLNFKNRPDFFSGPPDPSTIPNYIDTLYNITHSFIIFVIVFAIIWIIFKKPVLELLAWGLHIIFDIFTHSFSFFPTPFLWPISDFKVNAVGWGNPWIFFPNIALLVILYIWFFIVKKYGNKDKNQKRR